MSPRNLKWTAKEEASLKDGVLKHGPGKWAYILKDPHFRSVLHARSNVDLKEKWRNMQLSMNGEPQNSCTTVQKNFKMTSRRCDKSVALISERGDEEKIAEPEAPSSLNEASQEGGFEKATRFDDFKLDYVTGVKKPTSSIEIQQGLEYDSAYSNSRWAEVDAELKMIAQMSPEDAAAAALAAVKTADAALTEAQEAEKDAEEAEIAAKEAKDFAEQLRKELREKMARPENAASAAPKRGKRRRSQY